MKDEKFINTNPATIPWFAARDAQLKSDIAKQSFSDAACKKADLMMLVLYMCYKSPKPTITFRNGGPIKQGPKFVNIKLENPRLHDPATLKIMEADWDKEATTGGLLKRITKRITPQGIIYRAYF